MNSAETTLAQQHAFQQLAGAIARVTQDNRREHGAAMTPQEAVAMVQAEIDHEELSDWVEQAIVSPDLAHAYATVLDAGAAAESSAVATHAEGILDGSFGNPWWEPSDAEPADGGPPEEVTDQGVPMGVPSGQGGAVETVAVVEHADAAVACAAAAAAAAEAAAEAHAAGDLDAAGVVIVEDLSAACDEDAG